MNTNVRKAFTEAWDRFMGDMPDGVVRCMEIRHEGTMYTIIREHEDFYTMDCGALTMMGDSIEMNDKLQDICEMSLLNDGVRHGFVMFTWYLIDSITTIDIKLEDSMIDRTDTVMHYGRR